MNKFLTLLFAVAVIFSTQLSAQLRDDLPAYHDFSGPIVSSNTSTVQSWLSDFFQNRVSMSHSYSMNFGMAGGSYQNMNAYTNTLNFMFSEDLTGRVDVSFLHSPFGGSNLMGAKNSMDNRVIIRNAELNYKIGDNAHIRLQYQQLPARYGFNNPFGYSPYGSQGRFNRLWY